MGEEDLGGTVREEWWSPQDAARNTGMSEETMRAWAHGDPPRVESRWVKQGRRQYLRLKPEDVRREAAGSAAVVRRRAPRRPLVPDLPADDMRARASVLDEVLRRRRIIDDHLAEIDHSRQEIDRRRQEIDLQRREIEQLLLSPSFSPND